MSRNYLSFAFRESLSINIVFFWGGGLLQLRGKLQVTKEFFCFFFVRVIRHWRTGCRHTLSVLSPLRPLTRLGEFFSL
uniref:Uncharacterized protein n=1 Tax=Octopus bimaculoides TaxID=37653 RepID=A0A0L8H6C6_OCTBM